jgi:hypothetical protein
MRFGRVSTDRADELMHVADSRPDFSESAYYNFGALDQDLGGWVRIGNRVNAGYAEVMVCFYLPDGTIGFWYARPPIDGNDRHDAGGMRFEVVKPHVEHRIVYDGPVLRMKDPSEIANPSRAYKTNPREDSHLELVVRGVHRTYCPWAEADAVGAPNEMREAFDDVFADTHLEQHVGVSGSLTVGADRFELSAGVGLRDRSWGSRNWQQAPWYRWTTCSFGPDFGAALMVIGGPDGEQQSRGFIHHGHGREPERVVSVRFDTTYDDEWNPSAATVEAKTESGDEYLLEGEVWSHIPLYMPHGDGGGRMMCTEGMTRWRCGDRVGLGLLEYVDQIEAGTTLSEAKQGRP